MKFRNVIKIIACVMAFSLIFSGCSFFEFSSVDSLLKPPKLTGENAELQQAFEKTAGKNVALLAPLTGEFRSAYIVRDLNGDGKEEALVFYLLESSDNVVHINLLVNDNGQWISVDDITGSGSEVYKVEFCNIDGDDDSEIAVTWTVSDTKRDKTLSLYKAEHYGENIMQINPVATLQIFDFMLFDADNDGKNELFYLYFDTAEEKSGAYIRMMKFNPSATTLVPMSEVKLSSLITSLLAFRFDISPEFVGFYIDCLAAENTYFTEIVYYDRKNFSMICPIEANGDDPLALTKRTSLLLSADVNDDGAIEIPVELVSSESYSISAENGEKTPLTLYDWQRYDSNAMISIKKYYISSAFGFRICVNELKDKAFIVYDVASGEIRFLLKDGGDSGKTIFSVTEKKPTDVSNDDPPYTVQISELGQQMNITPLYVESLIE